LKNKNQYKTTIKTLIEDDPMRQLSERGDVLIRQLEEFYNLICNSRVKRTPHIPREELKVMFDSLVGDYNLQAYFIAKYSFLIGYLI
jgi:hypothetical protein